MGQALPTRSSVIFIGVLGVGAAALEGIFQHNIFYDHEYMYEAFFTAIEKPLFVHDEEELFRKSSMSAPVYGEMTFEGTRKMLSAVETKGKVFYDLGSGYGAPIVAAAWLFPELKKMIGIELSPSRHRYAVKAKRKLCRGVPDDKIVFLQKSMLEHPLDDADIIFLSSLCFSDEFMQILGDYLDSQLRAGTVVMSSREVPMKRSKKDGKIFTKSWLYVCTLCIAFINSVSLDGPDETSSYGMVKVEMSWNDAHYLHKYTMVDNIDNDKKEKKKNILLPKENKIQAK
eukprot:jgi/Bigna1/85003/estExt_fgenesh1_pg.C_10571